MGASSSGARTRSLPRRRYAKQSFPIQEGSQLIVRESILQAVDMTYIFGNSHHRKLPLVQNGPHLIPSHLARGSQCPSLQGHHPGSGFTGLRPWRYTRKRYLQPVPGNGVRHRAPGLRKRVAPQTMQPLASPSVLEEEFVPLEMHSRASACPAGALFE